MSGVVPQADEDSHSDECAQFWRRCERTLYILLKQRAEELGIPALLYAELSHEDVREQVSPLAELQETASPGDVLLHQLHNQARLGDYAVGMSEFVRA